ncbi:MAG TPA: hypothetical protein VFU93_05585 [Acidimicrobiales bacterium]|nr:hypothetical protein [Acidimicrobiales bacterium]
MKLRTGMLALGVLTTLWCLPGIGVRATYGAHVAVDEPQYLLSATSLWEDLDLDISDELAGERWRTYHESELPRQTKVLADGREVSPHDPLLPLVLAVPMGVAGWVGAKVAMAVLAGLLAATMLWVAVRRLALPTTRAAACVACFSLAAPLTVYGTQIYPELPGALALTIGVGAVLGSSRRSAIVAGLAVVALPWLSVKYAPVAAVLATLALWRLPRHRVALLAWFVASGVVFAVGHLVVYGGLTPYAAGDHFTGGEATVAGTDPDWLGRSRRLLALLVDRDYGLVAWQPAWLLAIPAVGAAARRRSPLLPILLAGWLTATFVALTMHGFWWPGRQVVVVLPILVLLIAQWAPTRLVVAGLVTGSALWWWLVLGDSTFVVHWRAHGWLRPLLVPANDDVRLAAWTLIAAALLALGWRSGRGDEDALAGEGTDADHALADPHGHGAVR